MREFERTLGTVTDKDRKNEMISDRLRIALISTPRSGNTWFRRLIASAFMLEDAAVHNPKDLDWDHLPDRFIFQCHWRRAEPFTSLLKKNGFRVVVLSRHPLDVLISILHFAPHQPETARWLESEGGNERSILGAKPCSTNFLEYATGPRAAALLSVSHEWRHAEYSYRVRYEDVVGDPARELIRLGESLNCPATPEAIASAIASNSMESLGEGGRNQHFWQGRPGLWKALLPAEEARRVARFHSAVFDGCGYECDPDESLDGARADANWFQLEVETSQRLLGGIRAQLDASQRALGEAQTELGTSQSALSATRSQLEASQRALAQVQAPSMAPHARLRPIEEQGPTAIGMTRRTRSSLIRHPWISSPLRQAMLMLRQSSTDG
jgi:hypothetical protein